MNWLKFMLYKVPTAKINSVYFTSSCAKMYGVDYRSEEEEGGECCDSSEAVLTYAEAWLQASKS